MSIDKNSTSRRNGRKSCQILIACLLAFFTSLFVTNVSFAQTKQKKKRKQVVPRTLRTSDGWNIPITYYNSILGKEAAVIVLLHDRHPGSRTSWTQDDGFAKHLQDIGYAVVAVDLRYHGESRWGTALDDFEDKKLLRRDFEGMVYRDIEAVKGFLFEEHQKKNLNMRKMGIVGVGMSAPLAVAYAVYDWTKTPYQDAPSLALKTPRGQDVRAVAMISPEKSVSGFKTFQHLTAIRRGGFYISIFIQNGTRDDKDPKGTIAKGHYKKLGGKEVKDRVYLRSYDSRFRGSKLIAEDKIAKANLVDFFGRSLKNLSGQSDLWRDRRSKYQRDD